MLFTSIKKGKEIIVLFVIAFLSRINYLALWPENPISLQFATKTNLSIFSLAIICAAANTLSTTLIYLFAKKITNKSAALLIALAFALLPTNWLSATAASPTQIYLLFFLLFVFFLPKNHFQIKPHFLFYPLMALIIAHLFKTSFPLVKSQKNIVPPSILATMFIKQAFKPEYTILITTSTYYQFKYYLPEFTNYQTLPPNVDAPYLASDYEINQAEIENYSYQNTIEFPNHTKLYLYKKIQ